MLTITRFGIQRQRSHLIATLTFLTWIVSAMADEPGWSDHERLENRDVVCLGKVVSTEKIGQIDAQADLHLAVVEVTRVKKGKSLSAGSKFNVYYERSANDRGKRCPAYAELAKGEKATFYLTNMSKEIQASLKIKTIKEPALFLEMGSDVQKIVEILDVTEFRSARISTGSADGAALGNVFSVFRDKAPLGRLKLCQLGQEKSNAAITTLQGGSKLEPGDVVVRDGTFQFLEGLRPDSAIKEPANEGRVYAEADLRRGLTRVLYYGKPWSQGKPFIDDETKYPVMIADGCVVGKDFVSFVGEYNRAMKEHFQKTANAPQGDKK